MKLKRAQYYSIILLISIILYSCSNKVLPKITMNEIPTQIALGDSIVFNWEAENAKQVILLPNKDTLDISGTYVFKPLDEKNNYIRFVAVDGKNKSGKTYNFKINNPSLTAEVPLSVTDEQTFPITWTSYFSDYVIIDSSNEQLPVKGELVMKLDSSKTINITAKNKFGKSFSKKFMINVHLIEDLEYPPQITRGDSCLVKWKYKQTKKVLFDGFENEFKPIDSIYVKPYLDRNYELKIVKTSGDTLTESVNIKVIYPSLLSFFGPGYIFRNNDAVLKWTSRLVESVRIEGIADSLPPNGQYIVKPDKTTKYRIIANVKGEEQSLTTTVNVVNRNFVKSVKSSSSTAANTRYDFEIFATDFTYYPDSVKLFVLVVDTMGNFITDLAPPYGTAEKAKKYFKEIVETTSNGKNHKVSSFKVREVHEKKDLPLDINMTLDYSGSMWGLTDNLEKAYELFINKMPLSIQLSMVRFSDTIVTLSDLTANKTDLLTKATFNDKNDTLFFMGTALYAAMDQGLSTFDDSKKQKLMLAFTDGYDGSSFYYIGKRATFAQQIAKKAKKNNVRINTLGFGSYINEKVLNFLAAITGGNFYSIQRPIDIINVMNESLYLLNNYYVITYKPTLGDNERNINLVYNSNTGKTGNANKTVFVGNNYNLNTLESEDLNSYWNSPQKYGKLQAVSLPQQVANFDFTKVDLKKGYEKRVEYFVQYLKSHPLSKVVVYGHTDLIGTKKDCEVLSLQRANQIKAYLLKEGIPESRIIVEACGKSYPLWQTEDKAWKAAENRRVELLIIE